MKLIDPLNGPYLGKAVIPPTNIHAHVYDQPPGVFETLLDLPNHPKDCIGTSMFWKTYSSPKHSFITTM